jgi:hypothetical protein
MTPGVRPAVVARDQVHLQGQDAEEQIAVAARPILCC